MMRGKGKDFEKTGQEHDNLLDQRNVLGGMCPRVLMDSSLLLRPLAFVCQNLTLFLFNKAGYVAFLEPYSLANLG